MLSKDCIASIQRGGKRDGFGQRLMDQAAETKVVKSFSTEQALPADGLCVGGECLLHHA
jgi:hypothetical protein